MPDYSTNDVVLVRYPFSDATSVKVRPAVVVSAAHPSDDVIVVPLTSRVSGLLQGEFVLSGWHAAGLNVASAAKRGLYTLHQGLIIKRLGSLAPADGLRLRASLRAWLDLPGLA